MNSYALVLFQVGGWAFLLVGVGHLGVVLARRLSVVAGSEEAALYAAMRARSFPVMGRTCNLLDMNAGFSVAMGFVAASHGALDLLLVRAAPTVVGSAPALLWLNLGTSLLLLGISVRVFPPPPIVLFAVASVCFALALLPLG